jgi:hypothetical protein
VVPTRDLSATEGGQRELARPCDTGHLVSRVGGHCFEMLKALSVVSFAAAAAATVIALAASLYLVIVPLEETSVSSTVSVAQGEEPTRSGPIRTVTRRSLADVNGKGVYIILAIPVLLAGIPLLTRTRPTDPFFAFVSAFLLWGFAIISGFSIGALYVPAALTALIGALAAILCGGLRRKAHGKGLSKGS